MTLLLDVGFWRGEHKCSRGNSSENSHELHDGRDMMKKSSVTEGETRGRFFGVAWSVPRLRIYKEPGPRFLRREMVVRGAEAEFSETLGTGCGAEWVCGVEPPPL